MVVYIKYELFSNFLLNETKNVVKTRLILVLKPKNIRVNIMKRSFKIFIRIAAAYCKKANLNYY